MCDPAALAEDESVPDAACWFRVLTNADHVTSDGTLHYQALKKRAFSHASEAKGWAHELSGRLTCLAGDPTAIASEAATLIRHIHQRFIDRGDPVPSKIGFVGVACARAKEIREPNCEVGTDVVYTPKPQDQAHSDVVTFETEGDADLEPLRLMLKEVLRVVAADEIEGLVTSCGTSN